ncbi:MAG: helix-turn-helix domain-containing protein [Gemmatales bacterium]
MDKPSLDRHETTRGSDVSVVLRRLQSVETAIGQIIPTIDAKLTSLHELLRKNRKEHLTVQEVAELTGRSSYTVRRWILECRLTATRLSEGGPRGKLLIPRTEVDRLIAEGKGGNVPSSAMSQQTTTNHKN